MRTIDQWLSLYGESHQNPTNKNIHRVCVPLIMLSLLALVALIPLPSVFSQYRVNLSHIVVLGALVFYFLLSKTFFMLMIGLVTPMLVISHFINEAMGLKEAALLWGLIFILAWIGQFVGHKIEGKKPSFLEDLAFLLIGPLWVVAPLFPKYK